MISCLVFFSVVLCESMCLFAVGLSSSLCNSFSLSYPLDFFVMISPFPHSAPNLFCLSCIQLLDCLFTSHLVCSVWSCLGIFLVYLHLTVPSDLSLPIVFFNVVVLLILMVPTSHIFLLSYHSSCWHRFLFCVSNLISQPSLAILFWFFRRNLLYHRIFSH